MADVGTYDNYLQALNGYFYSPPNHPYEWFKSFEHVLTGLDCSYCGTAANTALHTDLCSPLATKRTWSRLSEDEQRQLVESGTPLWRSLIDRLSPDLMIASVAWEHMKRITQNDWRIVYAVERKKNSTIPRKQPYNVKLTNLKLPSGKCSWLVFGAAAQTPFGTVSNQDRQMIGCVIKDRVLGRDGFPK